MIFLLMPGAEWDRQSGHDVVATPGPEGFVHCCDERQVEAVRAAYMADIERVVAVVVDPTVLTAETRYEPGTGGEAERYPHVYGSIPRAAVVAAREVP